MATMKNNADILQKPLEITTEQYYFDTFKPFLETVMATCTTDKELQRTCEKVINACNTLCQREEYNEIATELIVLNRAISDKSYFTGIMQKATEEEKKLVRELQEKISTLNMIIKCEPIVEHKKKKVRNRIGYKENHNNPSLSENEDYSIHNMDKLNEPNPKNRIPNT